MSGRTVTLDSKRLRVTRIKRAMSQQQLAAKAGLSERAIQNYERSDRQVFVDTLGRLAGALDVETSELCKPDPVLEEWKRDQEIMRKGMAKASLYQLAQHLTASLQSDSALGTGELVRGEGGNGHVYPFIHFRLNPTQRSEVNSILWKPPLLIPPLNDRFMEPNDAIEHWNEQEASGRAKDRMTYRLVDVVRDKQDNLLLKVAPGRFRDSIVTQDWLERELLLKFGHRDSELPENGFEAFLGRLPARAALMDSLKRARLSPRRLLHGTAFRSAALAATVFTVCRDPDGRLLAPVRLRSIDGVAMHGLMFHCVPSGMFQPTTQDVEKQWDLEDFVKREFGEELFSPKEDFDEDYTRRYLNYPPIEFLGQLLETKRAKLYLTGFGYNLWNLRPEILLLLFIDTPDWYQVHCDAGLLPEWEQFGYDKYLLQFNREFLQDAGPAFLPLFRQRQWATLEEMQAVLREGLRSVNIDPVGGDPFHPAHWVPPGAAAFRLGYKLLREEIAPGG